MEDLRVVTIGTSLGGLKVLRQIFSNIDPQLPAAYFVVQHSSPEHKSILDQLLSVYTDMPVLKVEDTEPIKPGRIYVSTSDRHLIIEKDRVYSAYGPRHNSSRPSVDVLFYSAALAYENRVISIVLSGLLYDGTDGTEKIKERGGITIVQDPAEADYDEMPRNTLQRNQVDYIAHCSEIGSLLGILCRKKPIPLTDDVPTEELAKRVELAQSSVMEEMDKEQHLSEKDDRLNDGRLSILNTLWSVVRLMQERANMLENMAAGEYINQRDQLAKRYQEKAMETRSDTLNLRKLLEEYTIVKKDEGKKSPTK